MLFSISFIKVLQFSGYKLFTPLDKFIPKHFIDFDAIVNDFFFFSFRDSFFLVYRIATDFCMMILYPATLLNSFIFPYTFIVEYSGLLYITS